MRKFISWILPVLILAVGLPIMAGSSALCSNPKTAEFVILFGFVCYNILASFVFNVSGRLKSVWSFNKIWHLLPGFLIGAIPMGTAYIWYFRNGELPSFQGMTILSAILTLATVSWEEMWFRGVSIELGATKYSRFGVVILFGIIFAFLHAMNPRINLLDDGLQLFVAGYALGVCYFAFDSIWAPIGMHFANNSIQALFGKSTEPRTIMYTGPLVLIAIMLTALMWRRKALVK